MAAGLSAASSLAYAPSERQALSLVLFFASLVAAALPIALEAGRPRRWPTVPLGLAAVLVAAIVSRSWSLGSYPAIPLGDEIRDGGLFTKWILEGRPIAIFGHGRYEGSGMLGLAVTVPFHLLFQGSVLTYRVPAALLGVLDVLLVYRLVARASSPVAATAASLFLVGFNVHQHYSRTEVQAIASCAGTTGFLLALDAFRRRPTFAAGLALGLLAGLLCHFHAAVRVTVLVLVGGTLAWLGWRAFRERTRGLALLGGLVVLGLLVGLGPFLFRNPLAHFLGVAKLGGEGLLAGNGLDRIARDYVRTALVFYTEPTTWHYAMNAPLLGPIAAAAFTLGWLRALGSRRPVLRIAAVLFPVLLLPLSALTDAPLKNNRLAPLYPLVAVFVGLGFEAAWRLARARWARTLLAAAGIALVIASAVDFFRSNRSEPAPEYAITGRLLDDVREHPDTAACLRSGRCAVAVHPDDARLLLLLHVREQQEFLLGFEPRVVAEPTADRGELRILPARD